MLKNFVRRDVHLAARFSIGMSAADAETLCTALNKDRDATGDMAGFNGTVIFVTGPTRSSPLICEPGNWIMIAPDRSLDVRADADFCANFCPATSS